MDDMNKRKETVASWIWRRTHKDNLPPSLLLLLFFTYDCLKTHKKMVFRSADTDYSILKSEGTML